VLLLVLAPDDVLRVVRDVRLSRPDASAVVRGSLVRERVVLVVEDAEDAVVETDADPVVEAPAPTPF
jgi:hypothetical protein